MAKDIERDDMKDNSFGVSTSAVEAKLNFEVVSMSNAYKVSEIYL